MRGRPLKAVTGFPESARSEGFTSNDTAQTLAWAAPGQKLNLHPKHLVGQSLEMCCPTTPQLAHMHTWSEARLARPPYQQWRPPSRPTHVTIAKCDLNKRKLFQIWKKKNTFL